LDADVTIIGAGVIGLAIASELANNRLNIYIIEKNRSYGMEISSRNSEVIHAGIYYPVDSLKARLCVEGRQMLYEICSKNNIPCIKTGKLIVAITEDEMKNLEKLKKQALTNGVNSVSLLGKKEVNQMEPHVKAAGALYSPETGITNAHSLMDYYFHDAQMKGADIVYQTRVVGIERLNGGYKINTLNSEGDSFDLTSERVINAAGLHSDKIAEMVGQKYTLHYCKGEYYSLSNVKKGMVTRLIYPIPERKHVGLGVHLTLDINGRMKLGPDATYIDRVEDYRVDATKRDRFYESVVQFLPFIRREDIVPDMAGIRPKLQGYGEEFRDFVISEDLPGFINLIGIESPGLTAAPAIARYVKNLIV